MASSATEGLTDEIFCQGPLMTWETRYIPDNLGFLKAFEDALRQVLFMVVNGTKDASFCAFLADLKTRLRRFLGSNALKDYRSKNPIKVHDFLVVLDRLVTPCQIDKGYIGHEKTSRPLPEVLSEFSERLEACVNDRRVQAYYRDCQDTKSTTHCTKQRWIQLMTLSDDRDLTEGQEAKARARMLAKLRKTSEANAAMAAWFQAAKQQVQHQKTDFEAKMEAAQALLAKTKAQQTKNEAEMAASYENPSRQRDHIAMITEDRDALSA